MFIIFYFRSGLNGLAKLTLIFYYVFWNKEKHQWLEWVESLVSRHWTDISWPTRYPVPCKPANFLEMNSYTRFSLHHWCLLASICLHGTLWRFLSELRSSSLPFTKLLVFGRKLWWNLVWRTKLHALTTFKASEDEFVLVWWKGIETTNRMCPLMVLLINSQLLKFRNVFRYWRIDGV